MSDILKMPIKQFMALTNRSKTRLSYVDYCSSGLNVYVHNGSKRAYTHKKENIGLREVKLNTTGYYIDRFSQDVMRGIVYKIPTKNKIHRFLIGYENSSNNEVVLLLDTIYTSTNTYMPFYDARDAASRLAESEAEAWYQDSLEQEALSRIEDLRRELKDALSDVRDFIGIIREGVHNKKVMVKAICEKREYFKDRLRGIAELRKNPSMVLEW